MRILLPRSHLPWQQQQQQVVGSSSSSSSSSIGAIAGIRFGQYNLGTKAGKCKVSVRVGKYKFKARAGRYKLGATADKYKFGARIGKYKLGARAGKYKLGVRTGKYKLGAKQRADGREIQRPVDKSKSLFFICSKCRKFPHSFKRSQSGLNDFKQSPLFTKIKVRRSYLLGSHV